MTFSSVLSTSGMVASPHYLATLAGLDVLRDGGNAVDAAIAANAVCMVCLPSMCGLGGDLFALVFESPEARLHALNASGRAPRASSLEALRAKGHPTMPMRGGHAVTVPGAVDGWFALWERFGSLPMERLLQTAIGHARDGFPVSRHLAAAIDNAAALLERSPETARTFLPYGTAPRVGDLLVQAALARSLELIGSNGRSAAYLGVLAEAMALAVQDAGGALSTEDLARHTSDWVEPLSTRFHDLEVFELPPNTQGVTALEMLNVVEPFDFVGLGHNSADAIHLMVEAKKLAFADRERYVADPAFAPLPAADLTSREYAARRRALIEPSRAATEVSAGSPAMGDTIYLCTADRQGNLVSLIQSLFADFGSGVMAQGTGIVLHNRGSSFSLNPDHPNRLEPGKRPRHTLIPAMAFQHGEPCLVFGTRGADGQPQTHLQLLVNRAVFGMDPQEAVAAPRWVHGAPGTAADALTVEPGIAAEAAGDLGARGHQVLIGQQLDFLVGTAQMIQIDRQRGIYIAGADPRGESLALGP